MNSIRIKPLANAVSVTTANQVDTSTRFFVATTTASTLISLGNSSATWSSVVLPVGVFVMEKNTATDFWTANVATSFTPIATR